jgi:hypothetical protein
LLKSTAITDKLALQRNLLPTNVVQRTSASRVSGASALVNCIASLQEEEQRKQLECSLFYLARADGK